MSQYEFCPVLSRATLDDYVRLFQAVYGDGAEKLSAKYLEWQYLSNPCGQVIGFDAYFGSELAGHYVVIPRTYVHRDRNILGALSANTATHPKHQGKGLFTKLADLTYEAATKKEIGFITGAANQNSIGGFTRKLGFKDLGNIRLYPSIRGHTPSFSDLSIDISQTWLAWRLSNPSRQYRYCQHGDQSITVRTRVKGVSFNLCRLVMKDRSALEALMAKDFWPIPALTPLFSPRLRKRLVVPASIQPSPWHVIWRGLAPGLEDCEERSSILFDGLSMDTF